MYACPAGHFTHRLCTTIFQSIINNALVIATRVPRLKNLSGLLAESSTFHPCATIKILLPSMSPAVVAEQTSPNSGKIQNSWMQRIIQEKNILKGKKCFCF